MTIYAGDRAPKAWQLQLTAMSGVDFTAVTAWEFHVRRPDGKHATWTAEPSDLSSSAVKLTHVLAADGSDVDDYGPYDVIAWLTLAAGNLQSDPVTLFVQDSYGVRV